MILLALTTGCTTSGVEDVIIDYQFFDNPEESRVELRYQNKNDKAVCIAKEDWPNLAGKINQSSDIVFLEVAGKTLPIEEFNTGFCQGEQCAIVVKPDEIINGFISYDGFNLPENLHASTKNLSYSPPAYFCD